MDSSGPSLVIPRHRRVMVWFKRHRIWGIVIIGLIVIGCAAGVGAYILSRPLAPVARVVVPAPKPAPKVYYSLLNGMPVQSAAELTKPVTAVIIENSPEARPQSGLKQAEVVYEAIADGGITRYLALYQQNSPKLIGPVRSLRPYFLDYAAPYQASIAHVGGSSLALHEVRHGNFRDIDQFFNSGSYWRSTDRVAPHNVYTSSADLAALNKSKGYTSSVFTSFPRVNGTPTTQPTTPKFDISFSGPLYNTNYVYQLKCNCYQRYLDGAVDVDREEGPITPNVVVALQVDEKTVMEDWWREVITTSGTGPADIFQNGTLTHATWSKASQTAPLKLLDSHGQPIPLVRGQTWIAVVPNDGGSITW